MPEQVTAWMRPEITVFVWSILDALKGLDESIIKEWVRETWPDSAEVYE